MRRLIAGASARCCFLVACLPFAFGAGSARASESHDLDARIAELEQTTVRAGSRRLTFNMYGQVGRAVLFWNDGFGKTTFYADHGIYKDFGVGAILRVVDGSVTPWGTLVDVEVRRWGLGAEQAIDAANVLVYAHDLNAGEKHARAKALIEGFWQRREIPCLSVQVLQELHVNLVRKGTQVADSAQIVSRYLSWRVLDSTRRLLRRALANQQRWQLSLWDSLIITAARSAGISKLWSEDLNEGQDYDGVLVVNPLKQAPSP